MISFSRAVDKIKSAARLGRIFPTRAFVPPPPAGITAQPCLIRKPQNSRQALLPFLVSNHQIRLRIRRNRIRGSRPPPAQYSFPDKGKRIL